MSLCGCGSELLIPVVDLDGPIRLEGGPAAGHGHPALQVCPIFAVRQAEGAAQRILVYRLRLDEPKAAADAMARVETPGQTPSGLALVLTPPGREGWAAKPGGPIPAQMAIEVQGAGGKLVSAPVSARLVLDPRLTRRAASQAMEPMPLMAIVTPLGLCFEIWQITPVTGGWMFWTKCIGLCLPFFSCQCWSFGMKRWSPFCGGWVPCICK
jgi:hypothetical protein